MCVVLSGSDSGSQGRQRCWTSASARTEVGAAAGSGKQRRQSNSEIHTPTEMMELRIGLTEKMARKHPKTVAMI